MSREALLDQVSPRALQALSQVIDLPESTIRSAFEAACSPEGYERFEFPKGDGRVRVIHAPIDALKVTQRCLLDHLFTQVAVTPFAHGFVPHRSIVTNALIHSPSARSVLNLDLQDAFPSVAESRVKSLLRWRVASLLKTMTPQLTSEERVVLCDMITILCTRDGALPQGAPTSGYLLNLACARLDRLVYGVALRSGLPRVKYTRYADDLTITTSSSESMPPELIAQVRGAVIKSGFKINPRKVHTHTDIQRAIVICGVRIANGSLALPKEMIKRYRAQITTAARTPPQELTALEQQKILGVISFVRSIYPSPPRPLIKPLNALIQAHQHLGDPQSLWLKSPKTKAIRRFQHFSYSGGSQGEHDN